MFRKLKTTSVVTAPTNGEDGYTPGSGMATGWDDPGETMPRGKGIEIRNDGAAIPAGKRMYCCVINGEWYPVVVFD